MKFTVLLQGGSEASGIGGSRDFQRPKCSRGARQHLRIKKAIALVL